MLALARKMRKKRARTDVLDCAYHRFSSHDDNLPRWFYEDEKRHRLCAPCLRARTPSVRVVICIGTCSASQKAKQKLHRL